VKGLGGFQGVVNGGAWDMGNRVGPTGRVLSGALDF